MTFGALRGAVWYSPRALHFQCAFYPIDRLVDRSEVLRSHPCHLRLTLFCKPGVDLLGAPSVGKTGPPLSSRVAWVCPKAFLE